MWGRTCVLALAGFMVASATVVGAPALADELTSPAPASVAEPEAPPSPEQPELEPGPLADDAAPTATAAFAPARALPAANRSLVIAAAIAGLSFSPTEPLPGGTITVIGTGCDPGEDVLVRTFSTTLGDTQIDAVAAAGPDGSFSISTRVWGAPGDPMGAAGGEEFGVAAYCGGMETTDPDRRQIVFGTMATPVGGPVPPVATPDTAHTLFETPVVVDVLANDTGDGLRVTAATSGAHGDVVWPPDGSSITYTPHTGFFGTDTFEYGIQSSDRLLAVSTVTITVAAPAPPVATDDAYVTTVDSPLHVSLSRGLLANDTDPEGDPMHVCLATSTHPAHGTLTYPSNDGRFDYVPDPGFTGVDTFTYHAGDRSGCGDHATVRITVLAAAGAGDDAATVGDAGDRVLPDTGAPAGSGLIAVLGALLAAAGIWLLTRGRTLCG